MQVLQSAQANAVHNHGLDGARLLVGEAQHLPPQMGPLGLMCLAPL